MTPQVPALSGMTPMGFRPSSKPSSTGGTITFTKTGLIHTAGKNFSGKMAEIEGKASREKKAKKS